MRLISCRSAAVETLGIVAGRPLAAAADRPAGGSAHDRRPARGRLRRAGRPARRGAGGAHRRRGQPLAETELLAPVPRPGKVVAIGRNYRAHAEEEGVEPPTAPLIFSKWPSSVIGHGAAIRWDPDLTGQVDYEAELAVVIGRRARRVPVDAALDHVLGYTCLNDVSARDLQFGDGQWTRGKSLDTFCPMGPVLVTADEIGDPQDLAISLHGRRRDRPGGADLADVLLGRRGRQLLLDGVHARARRRDRDRDAGRCRSVPRRRPGSSRTAIASGSRSSGIGVLENVCRVEATVVTAA